MIWVINSQLMAISRGHPQAPRELGEPVPERRSAAVELRQVRAPKMAELVANQIRRQIAEGRLRRGDFLPSEAVLMAELRVSRPALREALRLLEAESLIRIRRGAKGGAEVCVPQSDVLARHFALFLRLQGASIAEVFDAWATLEPMAARLLASRATEKSLETLERTLEEEERHFDDINGFTVASMRFYREVLEQCGNPALALFGTLISKLAGKTARFTSEERLELYERNSAAMEKDLLNVHRAHSRLVELVRGKKVAQAEAHWLAHVAELRDYLPPRAYNTLLDVFE